MKKYNIGIIGYGGFGRFLHYWWNKLEGVQVVAVCDGGLNDEVSGETRHYKKWEELLNDDSIDIVSIATPPAFHVEIACAAMRHNKHVLLEKPIALTNEGALEILRTQQETGMVLTIDHMLRYNPIIEALLKFNNERAFGKLRHVAVTNHAQDESLPAEHWFWDKVISGGIFIEHGVHFFDIVNALTTQQITQVYGSAYNRNEQQQDQVAATVVFNEGLIASHYHSFSGPGYFEQTTIRLTYDLAKIDVEGWMPMKGTIKALVKEDYKEKLLLLPRLKIEDSPPIAELTDVSRPEGWGNPGSESSSGIRSGGVQYKADVMVSGSFEIPQTKSEVYGSCLQRILEDIIVNIENPDHQLSVTADDAYNALKVAISAEESASAGKTGN